MPTPTIAVSSGRPAATSEPNVIASTSAATPKPRNSPIGAPLGPRSPRRRRTRPARRPVRPVRPPAGPPRPNPRGARPPGASKLTCDERDAAVLKRRGRRRTDRSPPATPGALATPRRSRIRRPLCVRPSALRPRARRRRSGRRRRWPPEAADSQQVDRLLGLGAGDREAAGGRAAERHRAGEHRRRRARARSRATSRAPAEGGAAESVENRCHERGPWLRAAWVSLTESGRQRSPRRRPEDAFECAPRGRSSLAPLGGGAVRGGGPTLST